MTKKTAVFTKYYQPSSGSLYPKYYSSLHAVYDGINIDRYHLPSNWFMNLLYIVIVVGQTFILYYLVMGRIKDPVAYTTLFVVFTGIGGLLIYFGYQKNKAVSTYWQSIQDKWCQEYEDEQSLDESQKTVDEPPPDYYWVECYTIEEIFYGWLMLLGLSLTLGLFSLLGPGD